MKYLLLITFLLYSPLAFSAEVVCFDGNGVVNVYSDSAHTPDYQSNPDCIINPASLPATNKIYWKRSGDNVLEMTQPEKDVVDQAKADAITQQKIDSADNLDISIKDAFLTWLEVYNSKVPAQYQVTGAELKTKYKCNEGLITENC